LLLIPLDGVLGQKVYDTSLLPALVEFMLYFDIALSADELVEIELHHGVGNLDAEGDQDLLQVEQRLRLERRIVVQPVGAVHRAELPCQVGLPRAGRDLGRDLLHPHLVNTLRTEASTDLHTCHVDFDDSILPQRPHSRSSPFMSLMILSKVGLTTTCGSGLSMCSLLILVRYRACGPSRMQYSVTIFSFVPPCFVLTVTILSRMNVCPTTSTAAVSV